MTVPMDSKGRPMVKVRNGAQELIPTAPYSNVTIGPAYVEKWVEDTPAAIEKGLDECFTHAQIVLGQKRKALLDAINAASGK